MVRLNFLAPQIVGAILAGTQPASVNAASLRSADLPSWRSCAIGSTRWSGWRTLETAADALRDVSAPLHSDHGLHCGASAPLPV
jgi:hypothetical protein